MVVTDASQECDLEEPKKSEELVDTDLNQKDHFQDLADDLIKYIFGFLNKFELGLARQACKRFHHIGNDDFLQLLPTPTLDYTKLLPKRCLTFDNMELISGEKPSGNFFLSSRYINPFAGCDNRVICSKVIPSHEDKPRGLYLYRQNDPEYHGIKSIFVLVVYGENNYETLNLTNVATDTQDYYLVDLLKRIKWPENKDENICLPEGFVQIIMLQCKLITPTVYQNTVYDLWDAKRCQIIKTKERARNNFRNSYIYISLISTDDIV